MNRIWLTFWQWGDLIYRRARRFDYQDLQGNNVFRVRVRPYDGPDLPMPDGKLVKHGEWVGFLHIYNLRLQQLLHDVASENRRSLLVIREVKRSLPELAEFVRRHPRGSKIRALMGVTLLSRGVEPFGFTVMNVEDTRWFRFKAWYMRLMMRVVHPEGRKRLQEGEQRLPLRRVVLPVDELLRRYGTEHEAGKTW